MGVGGEAPPDNPWCADGCTGVIRKENVIRGKSAKMRFQGGAMSLVDFGGTDTLRITCFL